MRILTRTQYDAIVDIVTGQKKIIDQKEEEIQRLKKQVIRLNNLLEDAQYVPHSPEEMEDRACLTYEVRKLGKELDIDFPNSSVHKEFKAPFDKLF